MTNNSPEIRFVLSKALTEIKLARFGTASTFNIEAHMSSIVDAQAVLEQMQADAVEIARGDGISWAMIGFALGTSKQAAQQKYGK